MKKLGISGKMLKIRLRQVLVKLKKNMKYPTQVILKAMDLIDPPVIIGDPANEASRSFILSLPEKMPSDDLTQVDYFKLKFSFKKYFHQKSFSQKYILFFGKICKLRLKRSF